MLAAVSWWRGGLLSLGSLTAKARTGWVRLTASRWGLVGLLVALGVLDYAAAKGLRALRDRQTPEARPVTGGNAAGTDVLSPASPVTLEVPGNTAANDGAPGVVLPAGVSVFVAPGLIDRVELAGGDSVDAFGAPDSTAPDLPVPDANRGALIARLDTEPPFAVGSRSCIFTPAHSGRLRFGVNDRDPSRNHGIFTVTVSIPEIRSVLAATPACGTVLR
jgi:hypothetical protein